MDQSLEQRVAALEQWKEEKMRQQISLPLDQTSQEILGNYFMHIDNLINYEVVGAASHTIFTFLGSQGTQNNFELAPQSIFPYTVNTTADTLFTPQKNFANDTQVLVFTTATGTFPNPLAINTVYFVVNSTGGTFQLSATSGGAVINLTTTGTGPQYIQVNLT